MGADASNDWQRTLASALEWWRDAGVDVLVEDEAHDWLAKPAPRAAATVAAAPVAAAPAAEVLPDTLDAFVAWRLGDGAVERDWMAPLVPPGGPTDAALVVVTDMPEAEDGERLMQGREGRLLDRMLKAIGIAREDVYLLSLAVARPITGQIPPDDQARLIALARHQLKLLAPARVLLLGQAASRVAGAADGSPGGESLHDINPFGADTKFAACHHPRLLLDRPAAKREAWKQLLLLRGTE